MSEASNPQASTPQPPREFHWAVTYLRGHIQDIRNEIREVHDRSDETRRSRRYTTLQVSPPSTTSWAPVTYLASSEARKRAA